MDILGLRIENNNGHVSIRKTPKRIVIADRVPEVKVVIPTTKKTALIPSVKNPTLSYNNDRFSGRGQFQQPEYDLAEAGRVEDTDSFVRQAFDKKVALMFKEGWDVVGKNPRTIKYVKTRFNQIARASGTPTAKLLREIGSSVVRKSNAFVVKVRKPEASGGKTRQVPGKNKLLKPVAAYFIVPAESMEYQKSSNKVNKWRQKMPDGTMKTWLSEDVEHFYYDRKDGFVFGTPPLVPVIDDIRALRKIEENIELLIYQCLFPLFQYKVGTPESPAGFDEAGNREVDLVRDEIAYMPTEGGIVTPERHEITAIGAEGRALRAEGYLEHFKKRVFTGLGISAVDMGEGETANRATADNMSRNLVDSVKDLQQIIEIFINEYVIGELLLESTFGEDVLDDENRCFLKFKEIDIEAQIKKEAHYADQFNKDLVSWDEARIKIGLDPILVPSPEEAENGTDNPEQYPEWHKTRWKLFEEPKLLMQSIDEPYSLAAKAAVANNSIGVTGQQATDAGNEKKEQEVAMEKEKAKAKIAIAKSKPKVAKKDGFLQETFTAIKEEVVHKARQPEFDAEWVVSQIRAAMEPTIDRLVAEQLLAFRNGFVKVLSVTEEVFLKETEMARKRFRSRSEKYINKLTNSVISGIKKESYEVGSEELAIKVRSIFDVVQYRTRFIEDVEVRKANSLGVVIASRLSGATNVIFITGSEDSCATCKSLSQESIDIAYISLDDLTPHHAGCNCKLDILSVYKVSDNTYKVDSYIKDTNEMPDSQARDCPKCGKSALKKKDTPDIFNCRSCKTSFRISGQESSSTTPDSQDELPEISQLGDNLQDNDKLKKQLINDIKKRHPDWSMKKIRVSALVIHNARKKENK